jgi:hypothetical protein
MYGPYFTAAQTSPWPLGMFSAFLNMNMRAKRPIRLIGKKKALEVGIKSHVIKKYLDVQKLPMEEGRESGFTH